jgi:hypothetical protein
MNTVIRRDYIDRLVCRSFLESSLAHMGLKLLKSALETTSNARLFKRLCGAANQAADLAWATSCPLLVFPCLFEEMAEDIRASSRKTADAVHRCSRAVCPAL